MRDKNCTSLTYPTYLVKSGSTTKRLTTGNKKSIWGLLNNWHMWQVEHIMLPNYPLGVRSDDCPSPPPKSARVVVVVVALLVMVV